MNVRKGRRKMLSVRLVWEDVLKTRQRETHCGGSVPANFTISLNDHYTYGKCSLMYTYCKNDLLERPVHHTTVYCTYIIMYMQKFAASCLSSVKI